MTEAVEKKPQEQKVYEKAPILIVQKLWGEERWMVNEPEYCMKLLVLKQGWRSSLHFHPKKKETLIVKDGRCVLAMRRSEEEPFFQRVMVKGDSVTLQPGMQHTFWLPRNERYPCYLYEVSTHHDDEDVVRLEPSGKMG